MRWRRIIGWTLAIVAVLIAVTLVGGLLFLRTSSFQRLAIRTIVKDVDEATGSRTEIRDFDFKLSTLTRLSKSYPDQEIGEFHVLFGEIKNFCARHYIHVLSIT